MDDFVRQVEELAKQSAAGLSEVCANAVAEVDRVLGPDYVSEMPEVVYATLNYVINGFRLDGRLYDPFSLRSMGDTRYAHVIDTVNRYLVRDHYPKGRIPVFALLRITQLSRFASWGDLVV